MKRITLLVFLIFISFFVNASKEQNELKIEKLYLSTPFILPKFAYGKENESEWKKRVLSEQIDFKKLWVDSENDLFKVLEVDSKGNFILEGDGYQKVFVGMFYLKALRWTRINLICKHSSPISVYLDGEKKLEKIEANENQEDSVEIVLERGVHRLQFSIFANKKESFSFSLKKVDNLPLCEATLSSKHPLSLEDALAVPFVFDTEISPDGTLGVLVLQSNDLQEDKRYTTLQVRKLDSGNLLFDSGPFRGVSYPTFDGTSSLIAFLVNSKEEGKKDLWLLDLKSMIFSPIYKNLENPRSLKFSPSSKEIFFIANAPRKNEDKSLKYDHLTEMYQRWGDWKERPHLFKIDLKTNSLSQITAGESNLFDYSINEDGTKIALLRGVFIKERPYLKTEVYLYDLKNFSSKKVADFLRWPDISEIALSKDAKTIAIMTSRGEMPKGGLKPKEHNAYNLNLFLIDTESNHLEILTENFRPSLSSQAISVLPGRRNLFFNFKDDFIYFLATDKDRVMLFKVNPKTKEFERIPIDDAILGSPSISFNSEKILYFTSQLGSFWKAKKADLRSGKSEVIFFPGEEVFRRVELGLLEPFDIMARDGELIQGWLLYPPNFDKTKKYPTIVAYYGGVMPYGRAFRSEFFYLAGQGYIVYIVTPRGSVGYGQEFADAHCNDWGKEAGEDIIEGVRTLIKLKPFVDEKKIGCFGGSYGGFMTLYLIGKSNLFAAAVDYYGISNIASYWGAGWWGFNYGDTAIANSYPWNRKEVFVNQSPIYFADKINTPLLLIHGTKDTNVPIVESDQIFTALKVQNKVVEFVRFYDENHGINSKPSIRLESQKMMLEWFDKYLKNEPESWQYRWKDEIKPIEEE